MSEVGDVLPLRKSLRGRGLMVIAALLAYVVAAGFYVAGERAHIDDSIRALEQLAQHEKALALAEAAVGGALVDVRQASNAGQGDPGQPGDLRLHMESCASLFAALEVHDSSYALLQRAIERRYAELQANPARASWIDLREALGRAADELDIRHRRLVGERESLTRAYQRHYDAVTIETLLLAAVGLAIFGSLSAWFFARLARDIQRLEAHAGRIVQGERGVALEVRREDEVGRLMHAVNRMAVDLDEREKQIRLDVERHSHQDKMLAVGALAAGVAHEVNNPLAVIGGLAQELRAAESPQAVAQAAQQILEQTQRAGQVARQLAEMAAPRPAELDWIDLNGLVRDAVRLMGYDRRYRRLDWSVRADPDLPAVRSSGNAVQQVLMQLLSLACDAMVTRPEAGLSIRIETLASPDGEGGVAVRLLFPAVLDFTLASVQRSLLLSRALAEPLSGRLALGQVPGPLQRIQLSLPADPAGQTG